MFNKVSSGVQSKRFLRELHYTKWPFAGMVGKSKSNAATENGFPETLRTVCKELQAIAAC
jgi:hypothetical protein